MESTKEVGWDGHGDRMQRLTVTFLKGEAIGIDRIE